MMKITKSLVAKVCTLALLLADSNAKKTLINDHELLPAMREVKGRPAGMGLRLQ